MSETKANTPVPQATKADSATIHITAGDPTRIGDYLILGELGHGGMGVVHRAEDPHLKREVALKVLLPALAANPDSKARFVREARAQAKVEHDHVAAIYQVAEHEGVPYIVMPLLKGMSLYTALRANPRPPLPEVLRIGREVAEGLAAAHEKGLIHRDIKPANIWLEGKKLRVKVLDFGLARGIGPEPDSGLNGPQTQKGTVVGTPTYMSPEQARGKPLDVRTDLWSLGVMLYQMTTGELPFDGDTPMAVLTAIAVDEPPPPITRNPAVPLEFSLLIMRLLSKDPAFRPPTAETLVEELRAIEAGHANAVRVIPLGSPPPLMIAPVGPDPFAELDATEASLGEVSAPMATVPERGRSRGVPVWAMAAAVLLAVGIVGVVVKELGSKPDDLAKPEPTNPAVPPKKDPPVNPPDRKKPKEDPNKKDPPLPVDSPERELALVISPYATLGLKHASGVIYAAPGGPMPAEPFVVERITIAREVNVPAAEMEKLRTAIISLTQLKAIDDPGGRLTWSESDIERLVASPSKSTIACLGTGVIPSRASWEHLSKLPQLNQLSVRAEQADDTVFASLPPLLNLQRLEISELGHVPKVTAAGWKGLLTSKNLTALSLHRPKGVNAECCKLLADTLPLTTLEIDYAELSDDAMRELARCSKLSRFQCVEVKFPEESLTHILGMKSLTRLDLNGVKWSPAAYERLAEMKHLQWLGLVNTSVTEKEIKTLSETLGCDIHWKGGHVPANSHKAAARYFLDTGHCEVTVKLKNGTASKFKPGADLPTAPFTVIEIATFNPRSWQMSDADTKRLDGIPTLMSLSVFSDLLTPKGVRTALSASKKSLSKLYLELCPLTDDDVKFFTEFPRLQSVDIRRSKLTDAGLAHLASLPEITDLLVPDNKITDAGLKHIRTMPKLTNLNLRGTGITDEGLTTLAEMKTLKTLSLVNTKTTEAAVDQLKAALPDCKIAWDPPKKP